MKLRNGLPIFLALVLVFGFFNVVYADSGPTIGANQAKTIAQNYLNSHNLPYKAQTPGWNDWKVKVKDTKTGGVMWIPMDVAKGDSPDFGGPGRYTWVEGYNSAWVVQVTQNGKNVGRIYVDAETGAVLKAILNQNNQSNNQTSDNFENATPNTSNTNQTAQNQGLLDSIINSIVSFFQQIWVSIFGSK